MKNLHIEIIESDDDRKNHILIGGKNYCRDSYCRDKVLYVYDDELFENLIQFELDYLLNLFERISITYEMLDDVWLDVKINPLEFYFDSKEEKLRASAVVRYDIEEWNKTWSIKKHSKLFFEKTRLVDGAEIYCENSDEDEKTGEAIYNLYDGFGLGIAIEDKSIQLYDVYQNVSQLCSSINTEVLNELSSSNNNIVERSIEFPREYHQAGLDILNYFGTYLIEQYPEQNAFVKIEQMGLNVRMVIETEDGNSETIEKALHEYELIVTGEEPPEKFAVSDKLIFELKHELRIAQFRLETQKDLIGMQNGRIDQLLSIVGDGLSQKHHVAIDFKPEITISNTVTINQNIAAALSNLNELKEELDGTNDAYLALDGLEGSLAAIETEKDPEAVRRSPAMSKFRRLIDKIVDNGSELNSAINAVESGWEIFSKLADNYNKVAKWCGLPVVPPVLIK
jgi:hypothetical protein